MIQTDQVICYDETGKHIECAHTGQDGDTRPGTPWPKPRFVRHGDLVDDRLTGLVWPIDAGLSEFPMTWEEGFDYMADMNKSGRFGLSNWRLPRRDELFTLISHQRINPSVISPELFINIFNGYYWTSTPCAQWPKQAWYIHLGGGRIVKGMKERSYMVWPVHDGTRGALRLARSSNSGGPLRFQLTDTTATDRITGITWTRDAGISPEAVTWQKALSIVKEINRAFLYGHNDWRLPTVRELETLTDMTTCSPAIAFQDCFANIRPFYWSSTTSVYEPSYAWTLYTDDGNIGVGYKPDPGFHVWPVRGASAET